MDCREARTALGRGTPRDAAVEAPPTNDAAVQAHLADCAGCRAAAKAAREADALLLPLFSVTATPAPEGVRRTVAAVRHATARPRILRAFSRVAAALLLLLAGGLGGWLLRSPAPIPGPEGLSPALAAHELEVFREVRAALGGDLAWLATVDGEVVVGLAPVGVEEALRVVLVEVRDDAGSVLATLNVVAPDGREVSVGVPGAPRMRMSIKGEPGRSGRLVCALVFQDGAELTTPGLEMTEGETALLGKVRTNGAMRSVYVALY